MKPLLIFDLDGVLIDTVQGHFVAWKAVAERIGIAFDTHDNDALRGIARHEALDRLVARSASPIGDELRMELLSLKAAVYLEWVADRGTAIVGHGVRALLQALSAAGYPMAVASASKHGRSLLQRTALAPYFTAISDGHDAPAPKPSPLQLLGLLDRVRRPAGEALLFEDAVAGVQAGRNAGVTCIGIGSAWLPHVVERFETLAEVSMADVDRLTARHCPRPCRQADADAPVHLSSDT